MGERGETLDQKDITLQPQIGQVVDVVLTPQAVFNRLSQRATLLRERGLYHTVNVVQTEFPEIYLLQKTRTEDQRNIPGGVKDASVTFENTFDRKGRMTSATITRNAVTHTREFLYDENNKVIEINDYLQISQGQKPALARQQKLDDGKPSEERFPGSGAQVMLDNLFPSIIPIIKYDLTSALAALDTLSDEVKSLIKIERNPDGSMQLTRPNLVQFPVGEYIAMDTITLRNYDGKWLIEDRMRSYLEATTDCTSMEIKGGDKNSFTYNPDGTLSGEINFLYSDEDESFWRTTSVNYKAGPLSLVDGSSLETVTSISIGYYDLTRGKEGNTKITHENNYSFEQYVVLRMDNNGKRAVFGVGIDDKVVGSNGAEEDYMLLDDENHHTRINPAMYGYDEFGNLRPSQPLLRTIYLPPTRPESTHGAVIRTRLGMVVDNQPGFEPAFIINPNQEVVFELIEPEA